MNALLAIYDVSRMLNVSPWFPVFSVFWRFLFDFSRTIFEMFHFAWNVQYSEHHASDFVKKMQTLNATPAVVHVIGSVLGDGTMICATF